METSKEIRVLLVDDHLVVRKGLLHVLNAADEINVVGEAENGEEALYLCQKLQPDIILMDVKMAGLGGVETARLIAQHHQASRIIGLSTFAQPDIIHSMISAGAKGYLLKDVSATELANAIRKVHGGEMHVPEDLPDPKSMIDEFDASSDKPEKQIELGEQQKKVLALMTKGFTNPEIAEKLGLSSPTARYHVSAILRKLDVSNRSEAVAMAIRMNLISSSDF